MINAHIAAILAFTALGANLIGAVLLLLLNAGSRSVRWYLPFHATVVLWLFAQGMQLMWPSPFWEGLTAFGVAVMPLMFLIFALFESTRRPSWHALLLLALSAFVIPIVMRGLYDDGLYVESVVAWVWLVGGWLGASLALWLQARKKVSHEQARPGLRRRIILIALTLIAPVCVVISIMFESAAFILYGMPVITIIIMIMIFYGITRIQLYDVEVRVRRTSDIATDTVQMERLAVLGEMAATIAHEVRNPLTGVRSLAQRLASEDVSPDKRRKYGEIILEETSRVERLVSNLLELSRRGARPEVVSAPTALQPLFDDLTLLVASRAERARVQVTCAADSLEVAAPREALAQVLLNLLLNAIAHSPQNSVITLTAERTDGRVRISVRDHGAGIPSAERDRIFDPFYTTSANGTGLGLSVVRHLVREHDWRIDVSDAPGGGARFTLVV